MIATIMVILKKFHLLCYCHYDNNGDNAHNNDNSNDNNNDYIVCLRQGESCGDLCGRLRRGQEDEGGLQVQPQVRV